MELESKYGSLTRGVLAERAKANRNGAASRGGGGAGTLFRTLRGGLSELVAELERRTLASTTVVHGNADALKKAPDGYRVHIGGEWLEADHVVFACPAYEAAALVGGVDAELADLLARVEYSSSLTLSLGYKKATFDHPLIGFGFLVPSRERQRLGACTWVQNKFSYRVPDDLVVLRCFFGGAADDAILSEDDDSLVAIARQELRRMMGVSAEPLFANIARWPRSMAQYTVGHQERLKRIEGRVRELPGIHLAGNAYYGIGIPDCVKTGREAAQRIVRPGA